MHWRLFKKNFIYTREQWNQMMIMNVEESSKSFMSPEGHPYQLASGIVNEIPNVISLDTKEFLKYLVDALNDKYRTEEMLREMLMEAIERRKEKNDGSIKSDVG